MKQVSNTNQSLICIMMMLMAVMQDAGAGDDNDADAEGAFVTCSWQGFFRDIAIPDRFVRSLPFASVPFTACAGCWQPFYAWASVGSNSRNFTDCPESKIQIRKVSLSFTWILTCMTPSTTPWRRQRHATSQNLILYYMTNISHIQHMTLT